MKSIAILLTGWIGISLNVAFAGDAPRGNLLELHSCEVFAGPCVVSSEASQSSRYMLRAWDFNGGAFHEQSFNGLQMAVLQLSPDNLAEPGSRSGDAVIYLSAAATPAQRDAVVAWLKSSQADFHPTHLFTRVADLKFTRTDRGDSFTAGEGVRVETRPFARCENFICGESLWYQPRSQTSLFTVVVDRMSKIDEPLLGLRWDDNGKRSVFEARFGEPDLARNLFVALDGVCGGGKSLF